MPSILFDSLARPSVELEAHLKIIGDAIYGVNELRWL
jgi:hypothetical protein